MLSPLSRMSLPLLVLTLTMMILIPVSAGEDGDSPMTQLVRELSPAMEAAVSSALGRWQPTSPADLGQLKTRLGAVERGLADLRLSMLELQGACQPEPKSTPVIKPCPEPVPEPEPEPACEKSPQPLPADQAPHRQPAVPACAESCLQLRDEVDSPQDGVYWFTNMSVPVLCDFTHDGGGWTLLLTAISRAGWDTLNVLGRNRLSPSLTDNYSILKEANAIRDLGHGDRYVYRIEAQAEVARRQWGGIWAAPRSYSFVHESSSQTDVAVVRKFNSWSYKNLGLEHRMPWLNMAGGQPAILTMSQSPSTHWWGTLVTFHSSGGYNHSPWIHQSSTHSGTVLYWLREEVL